MAQPGAVRVAGGLPPGLVPALESGQDREQQRFAVQGMRAGRAQRGGGQGGRGARRQLGRCGGHVEADADDDRAGDRLGQDAGQLGVVRQDVVRPFEAGLYSGDVGDRRGDGHAGEQREPAAPGGRHGGRPHQQGERQRGARRRHPGAAHPAAARALLLGRDYEAFWLAAQGPAEQVGVGRAGAIDDLDLVPQALRPQRGAAQGRDVQGRMVLGSHSNQLLFRSREEGNR